MERIVGHQITTGTQHTQRLSFTEDEIEKTWESFPYSERLYKKERSICLNSRCEELLTNFDNIGGNPETRPQLILDGKEVFVEGNFITEIMLATGYPTSEMMCSNYWYMVDTFSKDHPIFLVNFMHEKDVEKYGGWFFPRRENPEREFLKKGWVGKSSLLNIFDFEGWSEYRCTINEKNVMLYNCETWEDFEGAQEKIMIDLLDHLYDQMQKVSKPLVITNCRAGVGRTGTFCVLLHFYSLMKEKKNLSAKDFSLDAIKEKMIEFREARGDVQFVQTKRQFHMICRIIEQLFNH